MNVIVIVWALINLLTVLGFAASLPRIRASERKYTPLWWLMFGIVFDNGGFLLAIALYRWLSGLLGDVWATVILVTPHFLGLIAMIYFLAYWWGWFPTARSRRRKR